MRSEYVRMGFEPISIITGLAIAAGAGTKIWSSWKTQKREDTLAEQRIKAAQEAQKTQDIIKKVSLIGIPVIATIALIK